MAGAPILVLVHLGRLRDADQYDYAEEEVAEFVDRINAVIETWPGDILRIEHPDARTSIEQFPHLENAPTIRAAIYDAKGRRQKSDLERIVEYAAERNPSRMSVAGLWDGAAVDAVRIALEKAFEHNVHQDDRLTL